MQLFVEVFDVDDCIAKAIRLGAKVLVPKSVLPDGDTMAVLLDPTGLSFGVRATSTSGIYEVFYAHQSLGQFDVNQTARGSREVLNIHCVHRE